MTTTESTIAHQLNALAELQSVRDLLKLDKQAAIDTVLTPEIKTRLNDIDYEFEDKFSALDTEEAALTEAIKAAVADFGKTVKGARLQAIWQKGRVSWNTDALDGFALDRPELFAFRNEGKPSVSLRVVKG